MLNICLWITALLIIAIPTLVSAYRGPIRSGARLVLWIIGIPIAAFFTPTLANSIRGLAITMVESALSEESLAVVVADMEIIIELATKFALALISPIIFISAYLIAELILGIIYKILISVFKKPIEKFESNVIGKTVSRVGGVVCGILIGITFIVVFVSPFAAYADLVLHTAESFTSESSEITAVTDESFAPIADHPISKISLALGGKAVFDDVTEFEFNENRENIRTTIDALSGAISHLEVLSAPVSQYDMEHKRAIDDAIVCFEGTIVFAPITSSLLSGASRAWLAGESFAGMEIPVTGNADVDKLLIDFYEILTTTTEDTVSADLRTISELFGICVDHGVFASMGDNEAILEAMSNDHFLDDIDAELYKNDHLAPLAHAVTIFAAKVAVKDMGISEDAEIIVNDMIHSATEVLDATAALDDTTRITVISEGISKTAEEHALDIDKQKCEEIATALIEQFGSRSNVTDAEMEEFILTHISAFLPVEEK